MNKTIQNIAIGFAIILGFIGLFKTPAGQSLAGTVENFPILFTNGLQTSAAVVKSSTQALFQIGLPTTLSSGNSNGTFIGLNTPASTSADLMNLQNNGTSEFKVSSSGALTLNGSLTVPTLNTASVGISSSSPAALGSAASGHFVVAAGATTASASTTAVTTNSDVQLSLEQTTPIAGTTCNTAVNASSTFAVATKVAGNGFTITINSAPLTNPFCYSYSVTN